ncbi:DUF4249 domain-containing protein [Ichthyenterobacterium magnum]|uniref:Uncharacterized protein DUF4249 n=1 Tax=Ichthyenterobacterium magnum TaxID=1230530 RepID=A0A420DX44_9FLAO|nr:DUF4249 domain-containing protein [Ichthyenterobacterium magnum]RKE98808.1 uncharacterized protein DUF4249 [Ichthyenterobacterium magnum]
MKTIIKIVVLFTLVLVSSCEDVIDVNVPTANPRLVIEASLDWEKGTAGNNQTIKLSTSTPYFDTTVNNEVTGALVKVTNAITNDEYNFIDQNDGTYTITNFVPIINDSYVLEVIYNGETYTATETLKSVSEINRVEQSIEGGFDDEVLDVSIFWDDPAGQENYYLIKFKEQGDLLPILEDQSDEFSNGNEMDDFFEKDREDDDDQNEFNPGDVVDISLYGISERYYNYIRLLIEQYDSGGDPFSSNSAEIRGNCINTTNAQNYAFGYFRLSEFDTVNYIFE